MPRYCVNATMSVPAWIYVYATDPDDAVMAALVASASEYEKDDSAAEIEFNVTPRVEFESA
jgi:hypothetical protein